MIDYKEAFKLACDLLADSLDCTMRCPLEDVGKCGNIDCVNSLTWEKYFLEEVSKND